MLSYKIYIQGGSIFTGAICLILVKR